MSESIGTFALSSRGLMNIPKRQDLDDFEFIVGNSRYRCPWFIADFLSPRVGQLHSIDNTHCEFIVKTSDVNGDFSKFISLGRGERVEIDSGLGSFFETLGEEFLNEELMNFVSSQVELITENVVGRLCRRYLLNFDCSREIDFIASHFTEIDESSLKTLDDSILSQILSSSSLKIENEDWLYEHIWSLVESDRSHFSLVQFIKFEFVSAGVASRFIEAGLEFVDLIDSSIWLSLGRRFVQEVVPSGNDDRVMLHETRFAPDGKSLDGIISHLTSKCGGNVHNNGIITASSSSVYDSRHPKNALDFQNVSTYFISDNVANSWICLDFKNMDVTPTHYSILSHLGQTNQQRHPKSWCLEVSGDGQA
jgi:hypothetical protein